MGSKVYYRSLISVFLISFLWLSFSAPAAITDYVVKQWNTQNGLSSQSLTSVVQDHQGYMWLGTQFGLSRFDGNHFSNFNTQNSDFLNSNAILSLLIDKEGLLWIGSKKGLSVLNPSTMAFYQYQIKGAVKDLLQDSRGNIWVAGNELYYINRSQVAFHLTDQAKAAAGRTQGAPRSISQISVSNLADSPDGVWLVSANYLLRFTSKYTSTGKLRFVITARISLLDKLAQTIIYDLKWLDGTLYLATDLGAYFLDRDDKLRPFSLPQANNTAVYTLTKDANNALWVSTYGRLLVRSNTGQWQWVEPAALDQNIWFSDIYSDKQDNIWLTSFSEGLWLAKAGKVARHPVRVGANQEVMALAIAPDGKLWAATRHGVGYFNQQNGFTKQISLVQLKRRVIHDLHFVGERLYLATDLGVVYIENGQVYPIQNRELKHSPVFAIADAKGGGLWFGTGKGMFKLNYNGVTPFNYNAVLDSTFITFVNDNGNKGFIGTSKGGYIFSDKGIARFGGNTALNNAYITSMVDIKNVGMLVGTLNDGLFYRNSKSNRWLQLDVSSGLPYGSILSLYHDTQFERIWVSTMKGVYRMPVAQFADIITNLQVEQVISAFDRQLDGKANQCCTGLGHDAFAVTANAIWYPSLQGVVEIPRSVSLFGKEQLSAQIQSVSTINRTFYVNQQHNTPALEASERDITIRYTSIDFDAPQELEFRYRLVGLDENWRYVQHRREAIYTNLPPGKFTFELAVKRAGDSWQQASQTQYSFSVPQHFDETIYFRLLITTSFLLLFYLIFWVFRAQERRKQAELEALVESRTTALREANDKLNKVNSQLKLVSHSDELTGLRSRRFLFDQLPKDVEHYQSNAQALQSQGKSLVLVIINIDNFSKVNDAYGTLGGDSCLVQLAALLNSRSQGSDYVVRWSGDEFLLLLRDFTQADVPHYVNELCRAIAAKPFSLPSGKSIYLNASIGWSPYPLPLLGGQIISWETSVNLADIALQQLKQRGGDGTAYFTFDSQLDAFEFEQTQNLDTQIDTLQTRGLAKINFWMR